MSSSLSVSQKLRSETLAQARYLSLTTFRKTGVAVITPVWFAEWQGTLYAATDPQSGKVKRIRHTPRVLVAACTAQGKRIGETFEAQARMVSDPQEQHQADALLNKKYGLLRWLFLHVQKIRLLLQRHSTPAQAYLAIRVEPAM